MHDIRKLSRRGLGLWFMGAGLVLALAWLFLGIQLHPAIVVCEIAGSLLLLEPANAKEK